MPSFARNTATHNREVGGHVRCIEVLYRMQAQLNNGDNMKTLEEVQAQFESKNKAGNDVNILAYHPGQQYPIIAEVKFEGVWEASCFNEHGADATQLSALCNLISKRPVLPKDILCEVWDNSGRRHKRLTAGDGRFYNCGASSVTNECALITWENYRVIENHPQPWFGGKCPIPEGCEFRVFCGEKWRCGEDWGCCWEWYDITAYKILGEKESK